MIYSYITTIPIYIPTGPPHRQRQPGQWRPHSPRPKSCQNILRTRAAPAKNISADSWCQCVLIQCNGQKKAQVFTEKTYLLSQCAPVSKRGAGMTRDGDGGGINTTAQWRRRGRHRHQVGLIILSCRALGGNFHRRPWW